MLIWRKQNVTACRQDYRIGIMKETPAWNGGDLGSEFWWIGNSISWPICYCTLNGGKYWFNLFFLISLFESSQSLFWASFGMVGLENFELLGIKTYTRFWGLLMFGSYSVINVIVLLNLLIAMVRIFEIDLVEFQLWACTMKFQMSNSYAMIEQHSDTEWKFARTKLWMSYFEESATLPPPFNIFPTVKNFTKCFRQKKKRDINKESTIVSESVNIDFVPTF